ncbi:MAG: DUF4430 domain-containing protein [Peptococcaceae bacterium]|nr:MAG: DUF4430 domain-containing protein [Peptococcaceae bacterium]
MICFLAGFLFSFAAAGQSGVYDELAGKAVLFNHQAHISGETLNACDAYVLTLAGADLSAAAWVYNDKSLKDSVLDSVYAALGNPSAAKTKDVAYQLLAVNQWADQDLTGQLAGILAEREGESGFDNNVYSDIPAYEALGRTGRIGVINSVYARGYILGGQCVTVGDTAYGAWGSEWGGVFYPDFMTTAQAVRAMAWLPGAAGDPQIQQAIDDGLNWMQKQQQVDGSVYTTPWDDPVIDTAETIATLKMLGIEPLTWTSGEGKTPVDYMVYGALNDDGSFGASKNVMDATWALYSYLLLGGKTAPVIPTVSPATATVSVGGTEQYKAVMQYFNGTAVDVTGEAVWAAADGSVAGVAYGLATGLRTGETVISATYNNMTGRAGLIVTSPGGGPDSSCTVGIAVVGKDGELLYGPGGVTVSGTGKWGQTALGALDATGLDYTMSPAYPDFVDSIAGQANAGINGWMYKVNGVVAMVAAKDKQVTSGDKIIWWYSTDMNSPGPDWSDLTGGASGSGGSAAEPAAVPAVLQEMNKSLPPVLQASAGALTALENISRLLGLKEAAGSPGALGEVDKTVALSGNRPPLDFVAASALKKELAQNGIDFTRRVAAGKGAVLTEAGGEMALVIPAGALKSDLEISVKKTAGGSQGGHAPVECQRISALYSFGPDGTGFDPAALMVLKTAVPPLVRPENLALARYDRSGGKWLVVPAVVDLNKGLILAGLNGFSDYALFAKEPVKTFADVDAVAFSWAREAVEKLAGSGIIAGVDGINFEPERPVTRAEFTSLLVKALGLQESADADKIFNDVQTGAWYRGVVSAAYHAGLVKGCEDGTFQPEAAVTREETAAMLARAMKLQTPEQEPPFTDSEKIGSWARADVAAAHKHGLIKGFPDGAFRPDKPAGRAESATMIYRMLTAG